MFPTILFLLLFATTTLTTTFSSPNSLRANTKKQSSTSTTTFRPNNAHLTDPFKLPPKQRALNKYDAHQIRLESLGYFFKTYTSHADQALNNARDMIRRVLGEEAASNSFQGRASLFEEEGSLHKYTPLVYELAGIKNEHHKPKHKRLPMNHTIAMIETRMELGLIEFSTYEQTERAVLRRRLHLHDDEDALDQVLIEVRQHRNRNQNRNQNKLHHKGTPFYVTPRQDPLKAGKYSKRRERASRNGSTVVIVIVIFMI